MIKVDFKNNSCEHYGIKASENSKWIWVEQMSFRHRQNNLILKENIYGLSTPAHCIASYPLGLSIRLQSC